MRRFSKRLVIKDDKPKKEEHIFVNIPLSDPTPPVVIRKGPPQILPRKYKHATKIEPKAEPPKVYVKPIEVTLIKPKKIPVKRLVKSEEKIKKNIHKNRFSLPLRPRLSIEKLLQTAEYVNFIKEIKNNDTQKIVDVMKSILKCSEKFRTDKLIVLGKGVYGKIYDLGHNKILKESDLEVLGEFINESLITVLLSNDVKEKNTVHFPKIYNMFICYSYGNPMTYIKMEKLEPFDSYTWKPEDNHLKTFLVQICATLYFIQKKYKMVHQDLHLGNLMVRKLDSSKYRTHKYFNYHINGHWYKVPHHGFAIVFIDFGLSTFKYKGQRVGHLNQSAENRKSYNISMDYKPIYDLAYVANILQKYNKVILPPIIQEVVSRSNIDPTVVATERPLHNLVLDLSDLFKAGLYSEYRVNKKWPFDNKWFFLS